MILFCGSLLTGTPSHSLSARTSCQTGDQATYVQGQVLAWLDRYVKDPLGDAATGAAIDYYLQDGSRASITALPATTLTGNGDGAVVGAVAPTSGSHVAPVAPAVDGFRVEIPAAAGKTVLGAPTVSTSVAGLGADASVFFRLLDVGSDGRATVVDDQVTAHRYDLDPYAEGAATFALNGVAWRVDPGHTLVLEVTGTSYDHSSSRTPFLASVDVTVSVPVL